MISFISEKYNKNLVQIDGIFTVADILKGIYVNSLESLIKQCDIYANKHLLLNAKQALENVSSESIELSEKRNWEKLYAIAIALVASNAEQLLKLLFNNLVAANLNTVRSINNVTFTFQEVKNSTSSIGTGSNIGLKDLVLGKIYGEGNPQEKLNFQNIESILDIYSRYFGVLIKLSEEQKKIIFKYFQYRHIILHNGGEIDKVFHDRMKNVLGEEYTVGQKLSVSKEDYEMSKQIFLTLFKQIEVEIDKTQLILEKALFQFEE